MRAAPSEVVVILNDDIRITDPRFIEKAVAPFFREANVGLVSVNPQPLPPENFVQRGVAAGFRVYEEMRYAIRNGENEFTCDGKVLCVSKSFFDRIDIPENKADMGNVDAFLYFACRALGFHYRHVRDAFVYWKCPATVSDYVRWTIRNNADRHVLKRRFGDVVEREYSLPRRAFLRATLREAVRHPLEIGLMFFLGRYAQFMAQRASKSLKPAWDVIGTTKEL